VDGRTMDRHVLARRGRVTPLDGRRADRVVGAHLHDDEGRDVWYAEDGGQQRLEPRGIVTVCEAVAEGERETNERLVLCSEQRARCGWEVHVAWSRVRVGARRTSAL
jgi:hypothetical protein